MATRTVKAMRLTPETQHLLELLAAYFQVPQGQLIEEALPVYAQMRAIADNGLLGRELAHSTPDTVGALVGRMTTAIEESLRGGVASAGPVGDTRQRPTGDAKQRLRERMLIAAH
jgi:hypothetical protein